MPLLVLEHVRAGGRAGGVLDDVSMELDAGEFVAVWGRRGSGRTTLLRIAGGLEGPSAGRVWFDGVELAGRRGELAVGIGYVQQRAAAVGPAVIEQVAVACLAMGCSMREARRRAHAQLERVGAGMLAGAAIGDLRAGELTLVGLARALAGGPRLLLLDEPAVGVGSRERDDLIEVLRSIADDGTAVLMTAHELAAAVGASRVLSLGGGRLAGRAMAVPAPVVPLRAGAARRRRA